MFRRILVPLDGSARAERALPMAARLAQASGGSLFLVRVVPLLNVYTILCKIKLSTQSQENSLGL